MNNDILNLAYIAFVMCLIKDSQYMRVYETTSETRKERTKQILQMLQKAAYYSVLVTGAHSFIYEGIEYRNVDEWALHKGIVPQTAKSRIARGVPFDISAMFQTLPKGKYEDHTAGIVSAPCSCGNPVMDILCGYHPNNGKWFVPTNRPGRKRQFPTFALMCQYYNCDPQVVRRAVRKGYALAEVLTKEYGNLRFDVQARMIPCKGASYEVNGEPTFSKSQALEDLGIPAYMVGDVVDLMIDEGTSFPEAVIQFAQMRANRKAARLESRIRPEWGAFVTPMGRIRYRDHYGKSHKTLSAMANAWGLTYMQLRNRLVAGKDLKTALEKPVRGWHRRPRKLAGANSVTIQYYTA